MNKQVFEKGT